MNSLTPQQLKALDRGKNIAVTAGAGTGKTRVLVERYIDILINEDIDVHNIIAITFTEKAAAEMKERVALRLDCLLLNADSDKRKKIYYIRNSLNSAYISTIHAFCTRILKEYPVEAGLDPDFKIMNSIQTSSLKTEAVEYTLSFINHQQNEWINLLRLFGRENLKEMLETSLDHRHELSTIAQCFTGSSTDDLYTELENIFLEKTKYIRDNTNTLNLKLLFESILQKEQKIAVNQQVVADIIKGLNDVLKNFDHSKITFWKNLFELSRLFTNSNGLPYKNLAYLGKKESWDIQSQENLLAISNLLSPLALWQKENLSVAPGEQDKNILDALKKVLNLYQICHEDYDTRKSENALLDFDDLQVRTYALLKNNDEIQQALSIQFRFIMVDEFQDTNPLQWEIISLLGHARDHKFFTVGDPKQSIYGFRNADVRIFNRVKNQLISANQNFQESGDIILNESFRFKQTVADFINFIFPFILQTTENDEWNVDYQPVMTKRDDSLNGQVDILLAAEENQAELTAHRIREILKDGEYLPGQIAVLMRARTHLSEIEAALRSQNIPFRTIGGIGFYQRQEIYDIYHLIRFLINPEDDYALIALLRSPFAGISDEGLFFLSLNRERHGSYWQLIKNGKKIENLDKADKERLFNFAGLALKWINLRDRTDFSELINDIFEESFYRPLIASFLNGKQLVANLEKMIHIASEYESGGHVSLLDFSEMMKKMIGEKLREGEAQTGLEDKENIKVMTIHQAKGLEFPVVVLPYLNQQLKMSDSVYFHEKWGILAPVQNKEKRPYSFLLELSKNEKRLRETAELKRLLYVAATRTRDKLVMISKNDIRNKSESFLKLLLHALEKNEVSLSAGIKEINKNSFFNLNLSMETEIEKQERRSDHFNKKINQLRNISEGSTITIPDFLQRIPDEPKGQIFSATQIMTFNRNREEYIKRYHLGYFESDYERIDKSIESEDIGLLKGKIIHKYLENYPDSSLDDILFEFEVFDDTVKNQLHAEIQQAVNTIQQSDVLKPVLSSRIYKNELSVTMKIGDDFLTGTLDKLYLDEKNKGSVIDYKTNRIRHDQLRQTARNYQKQIEVYGLLLSGLYQQDIYCVNLYFTASDQLYVSHFDNAQIDLIRHNIHQIISEIKKTSKIN